MTTLDLVNSISETIGSKKVEVAAVLETMTLKMKEALSKGEDINISGLGKFGVADRKARTARNPKTNEPVEVLAKKVVKFRVSSKFEI